MPKLVIDGASLECTQGTSPSTLTVLPSLANADEHPVATVRDHLPMVNVAPFGMCQAMANPQVASATAAAQGVLTPQPCVPVLNDAWAPGAAYVTVEGAQKAAALTDDSRCACQWSGSISITDAASDIEIG